MIPLPIADNKFPAYLTDTIPASLAKMVAHLLEQNRELEHQLKSYGEREKEFLANREVQLARNESQSREIRELRRQLVELKQEREKQIRRQKKAPKSEKA